MGANLAITDNETRNQYTSVGDSAFLYAFPILSTDELKVSVNQVLRTIGVDYTVAGVGDAGGGTITFLVPTVPGEIITLYQEMPFKRSTGFTLGAATLIPDDLNTEFARQVRHDQEVRRNVRRALRIPIDDSVSDINMQLPAVGARKGKFLKFSDITGAPEMSELLVTNTLLSSDVVGQLIWPSTAGELSEGIVITAYNYPPGNLLRYGAVGDGVTDNHAIVQACITFCIRSGTAMHVPAGIYLLNNVANSNLPVYIDRLTANGQGLLMRGDGASASIFKESDESTATIGRFNKMFYFNSGVSGPFGFDAGDYVFQDVGFDKNSGGNTTAPPTPFAWEQAHVMAWNALGTLTTDSVTFYRCGFKNKIGSYLNHSGGNAINKFSITETVFGDMVEDKTVWGARGDIELSGATGINIIERVTATFMQIEPVTALKASVTNERKCFISNSQIDTIQYGEDGTLRLGDAKYSTLYLTNVIAERELSLRNVNAVVTNSTVNLSNIANWCRSLRMSNSIILLNYDDATNVVTTVNLWLGSAVNDGEAEFLFSNCSFEIDSDTVDPAATGYAIAGYNNATNVATVRIHLSHCRFDSRLYGSIDAYGHGTWTVSNCFIAGYARGIAVGAFDTWGSDVTLIDNDFSRVTGDNIWLGASNLLWRLVVSGVYDAATWTFLRNASIGLVGYVGHATFYGLAAPTAEHWNVGDRVINNAPTLGGPEGWACIIAGEPGTWVPFGRTGGLTTTTAALAAIADLINTSPNKVQGYEIFNTTTGLPVWAAGDTDGAVWSDATGATAHTPA